MGGVIYGVANAQGPPGVLPAIELLNSLDEIQRGRGDRIHRCSGINRERFNATEVRGGYSNLPRSVHNPCPPREAAHVNWTGNSYAAFLCF